MQNINFLFFAPLPQYGVLKVLLFAFVQPLRRSKAGDSGAIQKKFS